MFKPDTTATQLVLSRTLHVRVYAIMFSVFCALCTEILNIHVILF